jgi:hypothetical protein
MNEQSGNKATSQDDLNKSNPQRELADDELNTVAGGGNTVASADIEQTLNIGSQSSGAGAGKVTFNPFSITRK